MSGIELHLDHRKGLPADLLELLQRYPREVWQEHDNLGQTARFWLQRHDMFRELGEALEEGLDARREDKADLAAFRGWFAPRLSFFLQQLEGHHQIEDHHYFPVFLAVERKLSHGFELLEADHEVIHEDLLMMAETANAFLSSEAASDGREDDPSRRAADAYGQASERLLRRLIRHLADEEDLIVPLILDRTEEKLGL